jgi:hypothetical protein
MKPPNDIPAFSVSLVDFKTLRATGLFGTHFEQKQNKDSEENPVRYVLKSMSQT